AAPTPCGPFRLSRPRHPRALPAPGQATGVPWSGNCTLTAGTHGACDVGRVRVHNLGLMRDQTNPMTLGSILVARGGVAIWTGMKVQRYGDVFAPEAKSPSLVVKVRYRNCGALNGEHDKFCGQCGAAVSLPAPTLTRNDNTPPRFTPKAGCVSFRA